MRISGKLAEFLQKAERQIATGFPFVLYKKPDSVMLRAFFQNDAKTYAAENFEGSGYVFAPFSNGIRLLIPAEKSDFDETDFGFTQTITENIIAPEGISAKARHIDLVQKAVDFIKDGKFEKVVVARKHAVSVKDFDLPATFLNLLSKYPEAFCYCFFHPVSGLWLGAFAEQLFRRTGKHLQTMSVAGTQKWHEGLVWEEKEKHEQKLVTEFLVSELNTVSKHIEVSHSYTLKAGNLAHIKNDISAELKDHISLSEILDILHPTPAVCGFPKQEAKHFILENEDADREYYSGFHGELNLQNKANEIYSDFYVNLRCMKIEKNTAIIFAGGGITADSIPGKEWDETVNKAQTMSAIITGSILPSDARLNPERNTLNQNINP